jgi:hypothetical protein
MDIPEATVQQQHLFQPGPPTGCWKYEQPYQKDVGELEAMG